jgi:hypothetical protein
MRSGPILSNICFLPLIAFLTLLIPGSGMAQMFSLGSEDQRRATIPEYSFYFGIEPANVSYYGDNSTLTDENNYNFSGTLYRGRYESRSMHIYGAIGSGLSDDEDVVFRNIGIQIQGNVSLYTRPAIAWTLPLVASTDYVMMRTGQTENTDAEFSQNRLLFGLGQELVLGRHITFQIRIKSAARYGVSASSFGASVGTAFIFDQRARVYFDRLFGPLGLTAGIDYSYNHFMTAEEEFKYNLDAITFLIGINF